MRHSSFLIIFVRTWAFAYGTRCLLNSGKEDISSTVCCGCKNILPKADERVKEVANQFLLQIHQLRPECSYILDTIRNATLQVVRGIRIEVFLSTKSSRCSYREVYVDFTQEPCPGPQVEYRFLYDQDK